MRRSTRSGVIALAVGLVLAVAFAGGEASADSADRYLQTNLHYDAHTTEISSLHYLRGGMIPRCTRVTLGPLEKDHATVVVASSGTRYVYQFSKHTPKPWDAHLDRLFGRTCDQGAVKRLSAVDQKGVKQGQALAGMTKEGVKLALGIPPEHATPSMDADVWTYWTSRFNKLTVTFRGGKVVEVRS
jgi:hypothetical protein